MSIKHLVIVSRCRTVHRMHFKIELSSLSLLCISRNRVYEVPNIEQLYDSLMNLIVKLGNCGVIHGDFNEFNIMLTENDCVPVIIDFPQMVSISHLNAKQ